MRLRLHGCCWNVMRYGIYNGMCDVMICTSRRWEDVSLHSSHLLYNPYGMLSLGHTPLQKQIQQQWCGAAEPAGLFFTAHSHLCSFVRAGWISHGAVARGSAGEEEEGSTGCWGSRRPGSTSSGDASSCSSATMTDIHLISSHALFLAIESRCSCCCFWYSVSSL